MRISSTSLLARCLMALFFVGFFTGCPDGDDDAPDQDTSPAESTTAPPVEESLPPDGSTPAAPSATPAPTPGSGPTMTPAAGVTPTEPTPLEGTPTAETPITETPDEPTPQEPTPSVMTPVEPTPVDTTPVAPTPPIDTEGSPTPAPSSDRCISHAATAGSTLLRLQGTVLAGDSVLEEGEVLIDRASGVILCVAEECGEVAGAAEAELRCTDGVISAGLINARDQLPFGTLPRWDHGGRYYPDRSGWEEDSDFQNYQVAHQALEDAGLACEAAQWAEIRALMSGTTSVLAGAGLSDSDCLTGLVRNLDGSASSSGLDGVQITFDDAPLEGLVDMASGYQTSLESGALTALLFNVAEGVDGVVRSEADLLLDSGLTGPGVVLAHALDGDTRQLARMTARKMGLVWSPTSNLELYGVTTPITIALGYGMPIALASDWAPTGGTTLLDEMKVLEHLSSVYYDQAFPSARIVQMVTSAPAELLRIDQSLGRLEAGYLADVLVLKGDRAAPHQSVVAASPADVSLVLVGGVPRYGDSSMMSGLEPDETCETLTVCGANKTLCVQGTTGSATGGFQLNREDLEQLLTMTLDTAAQNDPDPSDGSYEYALTPSFVCEAVDTRLPLTMAGGYPNSGDLDGDGLPNGSDSCPRVFDNQPWDSDGDGVGDVCDPCPLSANETDCPIACDDGTQQGLETDVDCGGGICSSCETEKRCLEGADCVSGVCEDQICQAPTCEDGLLNGAETDVDCGGEDCAPCAETLLCKGDSDCQSDFCLSGICTVPTCDDGLVNGLETDVDCGGGQCAPCASSEECQLGSDCTSGVCSEGVCLSAGCGDGVQNGLETDVDCGGGECSSCLATQVCVDGSDCLSLICEEGQCAASSCQDGLWNGEESDVDCGGPDCAPCQPAQQCTQAEDCQTQVCAEDLCQEASCNDGVRNAAETDEDCGGPDCVPCEASLSCLEASDCDSTVCVDDVCQPSACDDGVQNGEESDVDCGGSLCAPCVVDQTCESGQDCQSGVCDGGICQVESCEDGVRNGLETGIDCGGGTCGACDPGQACDAASDCASLSCVGGFCEAPSCEDGLFNGLETYTDCGGDCGVCSAPADPVIVAPATDATVPTSMASSVGFLYTGDDPIQVGVDEASIEPQRVAVIRGEVLTRSSEPLPLVSVTILDHPEYGVTLSRADGMFDLVVNGGDDLTVVYELDGHMTVQRQVTPVWQGFVQLEDVVLVAYDAAVTEIAVDSTEMQVAQATEVVDGDGSRQATLLFPADTSAMMVLPNGSEQILTSLNVRATEYTVGDSGEEAMPATLPTGSAYTYAVEFSVDEAIEVGADEVVFSQPVISYLENFLAFPVGSAVPVAYYQRSSGPCDQVGWVPSENGRVVQVLSVTDGLATLDVDGSGIAASSDTLAIVGVTAAELEQLAILYAPGQSLWRVAVDHFSPWDMNWPYSLPDDADPTNVEEAEAEELLPDPCTVGGSIIECQNQVLGESIPVIGTPYRLSYRSDRHQGRTEAYTLEIPLTGDTLPASVVGVTLEVQIAGQRFTESFEPQLNLSLPFEWDGLDAYGRPVYGKQKAQVRVGHIYKAVYQEPADFEASFAVMSGVPLEANETRQEITAWQSYEVSLGTLGSELSTVGGWNLNVHHVYDPTAGTLYLGSGERRDAEAITGVLELVAGLGSPGDSGDGGPATEAKLRSPYGMALDGAGNLYIADTGNDRIRMVDGDGIIHAIAGRGIQGYSGDGGPPLDATFDGPRAITLDSSGNLYIADTDNHRIRKICSDGNLYTVVGTGEQGYSGDGGLAIEAQLDRPFAVAVDDQGNLYIADTGSDTIRKVTTDGRIYTIAGVGHSGFSGDGGPAVDAHLDLPESIAIGPLGDLWIADENNHRIRRITPDGIIRTVAGNGSKDFFGDGGPAISAALNDPDWVSEDTHGNFYVADEGSDRVRRISANGIITTVVGRDTEGQAGLGGPAAAAELSHVETVLVGHQDDLYIGDNGNHRIVKVKPPFPGFTGQDFAIASEEGEQVYVFNSEGRHLSTFSAASGLELLHFSYNDAGRLTSIEDAVGNVTQVARDGAGDPTAIIAPAGQTTTLEIDGEGYLALASDPQGQVTEFGYSPEGLLTSLMDVSGELHLYEYDARGLLLREALPDGQTKDFERVETDGGHEVTLTSASGRTSRYSVARVSDGSTEIGTTDSAGLETLVVLGSDGSKQIWKPDGTEIRIETVGDPIWGMDRPVLASVQQSTPSGLVSSISASREATLADSDDPFSLISRSDTLVLNGQTYARTYDVASRTQVLTTPEGRGGSVQFNALGQVLEAQLHRDLDPLLFVYDDAGRLIDFSQGELQISYTYDTLGRIRAISRPDEASSGLGYDEKNQLTRLQLPSGREYDFTYDPKGRVQTVTGPSSEVFEYNYGPTGLTQTFGFQNAAPYTMTYGQDGQQIELSFPSGRTLETTHDAAGRILVEDDGTISNHFTYDGLSGKLETLTRASTISPAQDLTFAYDGGLLTELSWMGPALATYQYRYEDGFRLAGYALDDEAEITLAYDGDSLLMGFGPFSMTRNGPGAAVDTLSDDNLEITLEYDTMGRQIRRTHSVGGRIVHQLEILWDSLGRIGRRQEIFGEEITTSEYHYDADGQLLQVVQNDDLAESYAYDSSGNRTMVQLADGLAVSAVYGPQDTLTTLGDMVYSFDADGMMTARGGLTLESSAGGEVTSVTLGDGTIIQYGYDGFGRRTSRTDGNGTREFYYGHPQSPYLLSASREPDGTTTQYYYDSIGVIIAFQRNQSWYYVATDQVGSPRLVTDATGTEVKRLSYTSFGEVLEDTAPQFELLIGFSGGVVDPDTGLVCFGLRDYEPASGRWIARDPMLFSAGLGSFYMYVGNNPVLFRDPGGQLVPLIILAVPTLIGVVNGAVSAVSTYLDGGSAMDTVESFGNGGLSGLVGASVGMVNPAAGLVAGAAVTEGLNAVSTHGKGASLSNFAANVVIGKVAGGAGKKVVAKLAAQIRTEAATALAETGVASSLGSTMAKLLSMLSGEEVTANTSEKALKDALSSLTDAQLQQLQEARNSAANGCP